jgi:hypothetical protein
MQKLHYTDLCQRLQRAKIEKKCVYRQVYLLPRITAEGNAFFGFVLKTFFEDFVLKTFFGYKEVGSGQTFAFLLMTTHCNYTVPHCSIPPPPPFPPPPIFPRSSKPFSTSFHGLRRTWFSWGWEEKESLQEAMQLLSPPPPSPSP